MARSRGLTDELDMGLDRWRRRVRTARPGTSSLSRTVKVSEAGMGGNGPKHTLVSCQRVIVAKRHCGLPQASRSIRTEQQSGPEFFSRKSSPPRLRSEASRPSGRGLVRLSSRFAIRLPFYGRDNPMAPGQRASEQLQDN